ncbi:MAG: hypothetical protein ACTSSH_13000 [Candidatus Heimdallarchaeota archaeon]
MSTEEDFDDEFDDEEEEWEYFEEEDKESLRDRVSIKDILKLVGLFIFFALIFLYFRYWDFFANLLSFGNTELGQSANLLSFGNTELGQSRLLYFTLLLFPVAAVFFIVGLVDVSKTFFIPRRESSSSDD